MLAHGETWCCLVVLPSTDFSFFSFFLSPFLLPSLPPILLHTSPTPSLFIFFFLFVTGLYFYPHPPFREFLKLYFPPYQRGLRLKKPMVPPQSLTLVSSNTSKLLPTCSYSSIQPFSHQVSASLAAFQGRQRGDCGTSTVGGSCWWLVAEVVCAGGDGCQAQAAPPAVVQQSPMSLGTGGAACGGTGFSLLLAEAGWVFSSLTQNQHHALSPQIRI